MITLDRLVMSGYGDVPTPMLAVQAIQRYAVHEEVGHVHKWIRNGFAPDRTPRQICLGCGHTRAVRLSNAARKRERIIRELLVPHATITEAAERAGVKLTAVRLIAARIVRPPCGCGRKAGHKGRCRFRQDLLQLQSA